LLTVLLVPVVLVAIAPAAIAPAAPVPKHLMKKPVYYYPTTVGATWVYNDLTLVVDQVEDAKGAKVVTVVSVTGAGKARNEVMEVSEAGLRRLGLSGEPFDVPLVMLQAPFCVGTTWEIKTRGAQGTGTIGAIETIKVPAGTFEAVRVDIAQRGRTIRAWFAPDVGLLKMTEDDREPIWLLKSFTPGKG